MQIIIDTAYTKITVKNKCFFIENDTVQRQISPKRISSIAITTNCTLNAAVIKLAANSQVPILFYNNFGTIQAKTWSPYFVNLASLRKKQLLFTQSEMATTWVLSLLFKKTQIQLLNLNRLAKQLPSQSEQVKLAEQKIEKTLSKMKILEGNTLNNIRNTLLGLEGSISRQYFKTLNCFLPIDFKFERRSRRPANDFFNAALNYLYGMTYSVVEGGVFAKGLDPAIGCMHTDSFKKPTLVFDLIEPIRPIVDGILIELIREEILLPMHFIKKEQGYRITKKGKRAIIQSFNDFLQTRIKVDGKIRRLKDHIYAQSNELGNLINESFQIN